jgi:exportin-7
MLSAYGSKLLALTPPSDPSDLYPAKYKGMAVCYTVLRHALAGDYINFGVFELYSVLFFCVVCDCARRPRT